MVISDAIKNGGEEGAIDLNGERRNKEKVQDRKRVCAPESTHTARGAPGEGSS